MPHLDLQIHDRIGHLSLNRTEALNALSQTFCREIDAALLAFDASDEVGCILITSAARHFCAGADIREMAQLTPAEVAATDFAGCVEALPRIGKPVVVAVAGLAAGGGCELVEMCDIVIAASSARFCHPEITLAAMPGAGGTQRLTRAVGKHVALDLLLTGRTLSAPEALAAGLVSRIVPDEELLSTATDVARRIAGWSGPVVRRIKAAVLATQVGLDDGLRQERRAFQQCFDEADFHEGLAAFTERRAPRFSGR